MLVSKTTSLLTSSQIGLLPIPKEVEQRWGVIPANQFNKARAVLAYSLSVGAWKQVAPATVQECFALETPSLGGVAFYSGKENAAQMVAEILTAASLLLNVGKNLRPQQIYVIAEMLLANPDYKRLTVADFRLAINNGIMGKYGQIYDRFDISVISGWLNEYEEERSYAAEEMAIARHSRATGTIGNIGSEPQKLPQWFSEFVAEHAAKYPVVQSESRVEDFTPDPFLFSYWKNQWEQMDADSRPAFEIYCDLQKARLKKAPLKK